MNRGTFCLRDSATFLEGLIHEEGTNRESSRGGCASDKVEHSVKGIQGPTSPVERDLVEETILNRVVLGGPGRIVADKDRQVKAVGQLALQFELPQPEPAAIAAAGIAEEEKCILSGKRGSFWISPPLANAVNSEL